ncbi:hypothetical protein [Niveispirillum irakense]|uniref:hypothetical protein n=1 Tax=Niveispirillum irakense TaxID=34011 RepID=UPI000401A5FA|nr:hypothetical protein [Niveispirillum irakense]
MIAMMRKMAALAALATLTLAPAAWGHGDEKGPKGGLLADAGPYHQELVVTETGLTIHLYTPDNQPVAVEGATGSATVLIGGAPRQVALKPVGANSLGANLDLPHGAEGKVVTVLTLPGKAPVQARYDLTHGDHDGHGHEGHDH